VIWSRDERSDGFVFLVGDNQRMGWSRRGRTYWIELLDEHNKVIERVDSDGKGRPLNDVEDLSECALGWACKRDEWELAEWTSDGLLLGQLEEAAEPEPEDGAGGIEEAETEEAETEEAKSGPGSLWARFLRSMRRE